jgi:hypothetical protein
MPPTWPALQARTIANEWEYYAWCFLLPVHPFGLPGDALLLRVASIEGRDFRMKRADDLVSTRKWF